MKKMIRVYVVVRHGIVEDILCDVEGIRAQVLDLDNQGDDISMVQLVYESGELVGTHSIGHLRSDVTTVQVFDTSNNADTIMVICEDGYAEVAYHSDNLTVWSSILDFDAENSDEIEEEIDELKENGYISLMWI